MLNNLYQKLTAQKTYVLFKKTNLRDFFKKRDSLARWGFGPAFHCKSSLANAQKAMLQLWAFHCNRD